MRGTEQPQFGGIVTSDQVGAARRRMRIIRTSAIVLAAVVFVGGTAVLYETGVLQLPWIEGSKTHGSQSSKLTATQTAAIQKAQAQAAAAHTPQAKAQAYNRLGSVYMNTNQPSQAITAYNQALSDSSARQEQITNLDALYSAYISNGDTAGAISSLQKVVALLQQSTDPKDQALIPRVQNEIADLQRSGS